MSPLGRFTWRWRRTARWDGYYRGWGDAEGGHRRLRDRAERLRLHDSSGTTTRTSQTLAADCTCTPCPGRGSDGECCFGSGIEDADPACPVVPHRSLAAPAARPAPDETLRTEIERLEGVLESTRRDRDLFAALAAASPPATDGATDATLLGLMYNAGLSEWLLDDSTRAAMLRAARAVLATDGDTAAGGAR